MMIDQEERTYVTVAALVAAMIDRYGAEHDRQCPKQLLEFGAVEFCPANLLMENTGAARCFELGDLCIERLPIRAHPRIAVDVHSVAKFLNSASGIVGVCEEHRKTECLGCGNGCILLPSIIVVI